MPCLVLTYTAAMPIDTVSGTDNVWWRYQAGKALSSEERDERAAAEFNGMVPEARPRNLSARTPKSWPWTLKSWTRALKP
eukprot:3103588-Rhodomonas_salina.2